MEESQKTDSGNYVSLCAEALISRMYDERLAEVRSRADAIIADARQSAASICKQTKKEAEQIVAGARKDAQAIEAAGEDQIELGAGEAHFELREILTRRLVDAVPRLLGKSSIPD